MSSTDGVSEAGGKLVSREREGGVGRVSWPGGYPGEWIVKLNGASRLCSSNEWRKVGRGEERRKRR